MTSQFEPEIYDLALKHGIPLYDLPFIVNGCSGGLSWFYRVGLGKNISCESCCHKHDLLYHIGPAEGTRKEADIHLLECARKAGEFPPGWKGTFRHIRRRVRAWIMYALVRLVGRLFWNKHGV